MRARWIFWIGFLLWNLIASEINAMPNTTHKLFMNYSKPSATQLELKKGFGDGVFVILFILRPRFPFTQARLYRQCFIELNTLILRVLGSHEELRSLKTILHVACSQDSQEHTHTEFEGPLWGLTKQSVCIWKRTYKTLILDWLNWPSFESDISLSICPDHVKPGLGSWQIKQSIEIRGQISSNKIWVLNKRRCGARRACGALTSSGLASVAAQPVSVFMFEAGELPSWRFIDARSPRLCLPAINHGGRGACSGKGLRKRA